MLQETLFKTNKNLEKIKRKKAETGSQRGIILGTWDTGLSVGVEQSPWPLFQEGQHSGACRVRPLVGDGTVAPQSWREDGVGTLELWGSSPVTPVCGCVAHLTREVSVSWCPVACLHSVAQHRGQGTKTDGPKVATL